MQRVHKRQVVTRTKLLKPSVISLFTCGMGMDIGFAKAGFNTVYSNDITKFACNTIRRNRPGLHCDEGDIIGIRSDQILERAGVQSGDADVVIGGPAVSVVLHRWHAEGVGRQARHGTAGVHTDRQGRPAKILRV